MAFFKNIGSSLSKRFSNQKRVKVADILNGEILHNDFFRRQLPFMLFILILLVVYINNRYSAVAELRDISRKTEQLERLKNESLTVSHELMEMGRQSYVVEKLKNQGSSLELSLEPATEIE